MITTPYHRWLIKHRVYCARCIDSWTHGTTVRSINGREAVLCSEHASRLDAVRRSDKRQETQT